MPSQSVAPPWLGFVPSTTAPSASTLALSTATTYYAMSFIASQNETVNEARLYMSAKTGTIGTGDLQADIYSDLNGVPNASLGSTVTSSSQVVGWVSFTGLSVAVEAGKMYWIVVRNLNATPGTNTPTFISLGARSGVTIGGGDGTGFYGWHRSSTTNGGTSWSAPSANSAGLRIKFASGNVVGIPASATGFTPSGNRAYGTQELGAKFVTPSNATLRVRGVAFALGGAGTPAGDAVLKLYLGSSTSATKTAAKVPKGNIPASSAQYVPFYFVDGSGNADVVSISPGTTVRCTVSQDGGLGTTSTAYISPIEYTWDSDSASLALVPFASVRTNLTSGAWSDSTNFVMPFALILDSEQPYAASGGTTSTDPGEANVKTGVGYMIEDVAKTGTYTGSDRWTDPGVANVLVGVNYKADSTTNNRVGTVTLPDIADVESGVTYGASLGLTGTLIVGGGGTYTDPGIANVKTGTGYTYNSVSLTGTYDGSDRWTDPGIANVLIGVNYKVNSLTNNRTGNVTLPDISEVESGVTFGSLLGLTGTLVVSGGGGTSDWTSSEKAQIRYRLGIDGTQTQPTATAATLINGSPMSSSDGTVASATNGTVVMDASAPTPGNNTLVGWRVTVRAGTGLLQSRIVTANTGKTLTLDRNWDTNPDNTYTYVMDPALVYDPSGVTTLLSRLTSGRATNLDNLDATITSRMATFTYTAPPTLAAITGGVDAVLSDDVAAIIIAINTRAPASTALSNATWTDAKAAFLDVAISSRATAGGITQEDIDAIAAGVVDSIGDQQSDSPGVTTLLTRLTDARGTKIDFLDATISSRSTYAGGAVTVSDKTGFKLAADGLDSIGQTMTGVPDTFVKKLLWVFHEKWRATRNKTTGMKTVYGSTGSVATTQTTTDTDTQQTISAGT